MNNYENKSRYDILNDQQKNYININYSLLNMIANLNIGNFRKKQEDSVLLLYHPLCTEFKLLAVADGMGGLINGAQASNIALLEIISWFEKLPKEYYSKEKQIYQELPIVLEYIDKKIRKICYSGGTTLSIAIISKNNTIFLNIGDSRIYIYNANLLNQISIDHSISWDLFTEGIIKTKDDIRFHRQNHLITSRLGGEKKMLIISNEILSNHDYNSIFLFSDGITDCLSDDELTKIICNNTSDNIVNLIKNATLSTTSVNENLDSLTYYDTIYGGKDNHAIATLIKRKAK